MGKGKVASGHSGRTRASVVSKIVVTGVTWVVVGTLCAGISAGHMADRRVRPALHVMPFPGTPDASASSEIIFSSLSRSDLESVRVRGSQGGLHAGRVSTLPAHAGVAFSPSRPFTLGERVSVTATLTTPQAGTDSGDPGATTLSWSFIVAVPGGSQTSAGVRHPARGTSSLPVQHFRSRPDLRPPRVTASADPDHGSGDIFVNVQLGSYWAGTRLQGGPMILDSQGRLVWFRPVPHRLVLDVAAQRYRREPVLTWWQGNLSSDQGVDVILDRSYRRIATVRGAEGYRPDLHEFQITPQGTAWVSATQPVAANLTSVGGPRHGVVQDCVIQEIDIRTGRLLWEWHALGHVPLTDSYLRLGGSRVFDYFHLNSIQQLPHHRVLISARNTWTLYEIDERTGRIIWRLGGKHSSFRTGQGTRFEWQHDARLVGHRLSLFDDAALPQEEPQSSAKLLTVDQATMTVSLASRFTHTPPLLSSGAGSMQVLSNGNVFVSWGSVPNFSEYTAAGKQIFDAHLPLGTDTYRARRFHWVGQPTTAPALAVTRSKNRSTVDVSWNGATRVASWRVLGGSSAGHLTAIARARRTGFETAIQIESVPRYVAVEALDTSGQVVGSSAPKKTPR